MLIQEFVMKKPVTSNTNTRGEATNRSPEGKTSRNLLIGNEDI